MADVHIASLQKELDVFEPELRAPCTCGRQLIIGKAGADGQRVLLHAMPFCDDFEYLEPADYLEKVRKHLEALD
jgi:hypothetical protein